MESVTKYLTVIFFIFICSSIISQKRDVSFVVDDILIREKLFIYEGDTTVEVNIFKIKVHNDFISYNQSISILFSSDTIVAYDYKRSYQTKLVDTLSNDCLIHKNDSLDYVNSIVKVLFKHVFNQNKRIGMLQSHQERKCFDVLHKILLILNDDRLNFLNELVMYINLDISSLEAQFYDAKIKEDFNKMFFISLIYRVNRYSYFFNEYPKIDFEDYFGKTLDQNDFYTYGDLFRNEELVLLDKFFSIESKVYVLNNNCW